ncbi:hypothetical protein E2C01_099874 [Portunus trituberculatus]|uniref:Uncharacterized protein n=1 Tax=Portunus trituberculatus TaxID=210409 RepID=A0A5B7KAN0_PORTR|nr:hypothetical protein [Portunus trituberculatus]
MELDFFREQSCVVCEHEPQTGTWSGCSSGPSDAPPRYPFFTAPSNRKKPKPTPSGRDSSDPRPPPHPPPAFMNS